MKKVGFLGCGNMASAIISGIHKANMDTTMMGFDINKEQVEKQDCYGVKYMPLAELINECEYLVLAVKPQFLTEAVKDIKTSINRDTVIISIVAGATKQSIDNLFGFDTKSVLVMPNTPLMIGQGATAIAKNDTLDSDKFSFVCDMFSASGMVCLIDEDKLKEIIPINGSSPAYIYNFAKQFINYANEVGIDAKMAKQLFAQTLIGSANMMLQSDDSIDTLIDKVCSKGGTTIAGLDKMKSLGFDECVIEGLKSCTQRAYELGKI